LKQPHNTRRQSTKGDSGISMQIGFKNEGALYIIERTIINKLFSGVKSFGNNPYINNLTNM
jgi:hypothetical protein